MKSLTDGQSTADLYNYETDGDPTVLDCPQIPDEEHHPNLREVKEMNMGKSAGVDNITAKLVQAGGEAMIDILTSICNKIWKTGKMVDQMDSISSYYSQRKATCSCARTIELQV